MINEPETKIEAKVKRERGRPRHPDGISHTKQLTIRLSTAEREALQKHCDEHGISKGGFIRSRIADVINPDTEK